MKCIVFPIYKSFDSLCEKELISIVQLYKILGRHSVFFIGPQSLNWDPYVRHAGIYNVTVERKLFDEDFFSGLDGYNRLLKSLIFYAEFSKFEYMLIYQTDAFVFSDELEFWCNKDYDFIGAPWFEDYHDATETSRIIGVGNGGFSLRRIPVFIKVLKRLAFLRKMGRFYRFFVRKRSANGIHLNHIILAPITLQEDFFWTQYAPLILSSFSVAPVSEALQFSFEVCPSVLLNMNNNKLPFGCHAWWRYDLEFWRPFIEHFGYSLENNNLALHD